MTGKKGKARLRTEDEIRERIKYWEDTDPLLARLCGTGGRIAELKWMLGEE
jgi:hypothetical protein